VRIVAGILLTFSAAATVVGVVLVLVEWWSPTMTVDARPGLLFLGGIVGLISGAGLVRWARIRDARRWWMP